MVAIHEAKQSDIKRLLELSLMWEKEESCYKNHIEPIQKMTSRLTLSPTNLTLTNLPSR